MLTSLRRQIYQLGRAFTAVTLVEGTVHVARRHALDLIELEQQLHIFWKILVQKFFMSFPLLMASINYLYSFIHIPGTITSLVFLYYHTTTRNRLIQRRPPQYENTIEQTRSSCGPQFYEARRRTMAVCNLLAFVVFTLWPCMPPRLLSDPEYEETQSEIAESFGFVDTVHGKNGASSVWMQNRFCNQYAAMPSLHFGYSFAGWTYDHVNPSCSPAFAAIENDSSALLQSQPSESIPKDSASQHLPNAVRRSRIAVPVLHSSRHYRDSESLHLGRESQGRLFAVLDGIRTICS